MEGKRMVLGAAQWLVTAELPSASSILTLGMGAPLFFIFLKSLLAKRIPRVLVESTDDAETLDVLTGRKILDPDTVSPIDKSKPGQICCWDPCTMQDLGTVKAFTPVRLEARLHGCLWEDAYGTYKQVLHAPRSIYFSPLIFPELHQTNSPVTSFFLSLLCPKARIL
jgi:hypothetical protein